MRGQDKAEAYYHLLESVADDYGVEYNPAPGPKWQAINGILRMPGLNATEMAVAACLIDHAHDEHGFAFPSRESIQHWTRRSKSAVDRALGKLKGLGLIEGVERRLNYTKSATTLYLITWQPFFNAFLKVEAWKAERRHAGGVVPANGSGWSPQSGQVVPGNGEHISLTYLSNEDLYRSPYGDPLKDFHQGLSGETQLTSEQVERPKGFQKDPTSFSSRHWWINRLAEAEAALEETSDPEQRKELEAKIARYRARIEEMPYEQRSKVGARRG